MKKSTFRSAVADSAIATGGWFSALIMTLALGLAFGGAALGQTSTTFAQHNFEVISVNGHTLVVRDERGTNAYTVPDDFRMTVDGKKMSVAELKPGMKGTATVTTTTTSKPVFVTEVKEGVVLDAGPGSITIRNADGTQTPPREVVLNHRCAAFVAAMQALARAKLATIESPSQGRARDGEPATAHELDTERIRQNC